MAHTIRDRKRLLARIRRIGGQAAALEKALVTCPRNFGHGIT